MAKKLVILGAGESGIGTALLAKQKGYEVFVSDAGAIKANFQKELEDNAIEYEAGSHNVDRILAADEVMKSPGIPEKSEMVKAIRAKGIPVVSEIEFGYRYKGNSKIAAITGSNGKSTTTALLYHICKMVDDNVAMVGNIGYSFARQIAQARSARDRNAQLAKAKKRHTLEDVLDTLKKGATQELRLIIKGDVSGSVEALEDALMAIEVSDEVDLRVIHRGVGAITKSDIDLASASTAVVLGFNAKPEPQTAIYADEQGVEIRFYSVIYQAIEDIELSLKGMLKPEYEEAILGNAEVRSIFKSSKAGTIAGSLVMDGIIKRNAKARLLRGGSVIVDNLTVDSLKRFIDDVTEVRDGYECGIGIGNVKELEVGDTIQVFEMQEKKR